MYLLKLILLLCVIQRMNIININLGSFNTSKELLKHYAQEKKAHVACLSETFENSTMFNFQAGSNSQNLGTILKISSPEVEWQFLSTRIPNLRVTTLQTSLTLR